MAKARTQSLRTAPFVFSGVNSLTPWLLRKRVASGATTRLDSPHTYTDCGAVGAGVGLTPAVFDRGGEATMSGAATEGTAVGVGKLEARERNAITPPPAKPPTRAVTNKINQGLNRCRSTV